MPVDRKINEDIKIEDLSKENLLELLHIYAKDWLAHDGCWFQAIEKKMVNSFLLVIINPCPFSL